MAKARGAAMKDLIAQLEALTGPDTDVDLAIWRHLGKHRPAAHVPVPFFTLRIDAALTLMLAGWTIRVTQIRFGLWRVELWRGDKSTKTPPNIEVIASTEPIARSIAALKAREADNG